MTTADQSRRLRSTTVPAVVLDAVALIGLVLVGCGAFFRGELLGLVFLGGLLGVAALPGAVLSAIVLVRRARERGVGRARTASSIAVLALCALVVGPAVLAASWAATPNPADARLRPFEQRVEALGGRRICANGDPGRGPDNLSAWREAVFMAPASVGTVAQLTEQAAANGYDLRATRTTDSPLSGTRTFSADRADGGGHSTELTVEISSGGIPLRCGSDYGRVQRPDPGHVVVDIAGEIDPAK